MPPSVDPEPLLATPPGPLPRYRARLAAGELLADPAQERAARRLDDLWHALGSYKPHPEERGGWRERLGLVRPAPAPPRGLYIWGAVGRGKSMLMDMFYESVPLARKLRVHFYAFMLDVHERIHARREEKGDPIGPVARELAEEAALLCFDEFQVVDIADAMILGRLFAALFEAGVVVVATSNRAPAELYKDGLLRERFLPFIDLLQARLDVLELDGARDYRLARFAGRQTYFVPADNNAYRALERAFGDLTGHASATAATLTVQGRTLAVPRAAKGVCWFGFEELCARALGAADYLALTRHYHTLILEGIPRLGPEQRNEARRLHILIDALYEAHGNLIASADAPPAELYPGGDGSFEFHRTVSRLIEMQSEAWIAGRPG